MLDLKDYYHNGTSNVNEELLGKEVRNFKPTLVVISICFSKVSKVKVILEKSAVLPVIRMKRNLIAATNGKVIDLDENQEELIQMVVDPKKPTNIEKNLVIQGPEGKVCRVDVMEYVQYSILLKVSKTLKRKQSEFSESMPQITGSEYYNCT